MLEKSFETDRLIFREINAGDAKDIVAFRSKPAVFRYFKNPHQITIEEHLNWYENRYLSDDDRIDFMCVEKESSNKVGVFGIVMKNGSAEVNYLLSDSAQHKGYASEAVNGLMEYAKKMFGIRIFTAEIHKDNLASINLAKRLGFVEHFEDGEFITFKLEKIKG